jgi:hypothetical protein
MSVRRDLLAPGVPLERGMAGLLTGCTTRQEIERAF